MKAFILLVQCQADVVRCIKSVESEVYGYGVVYRGRRGDGEVMQYKPRCRTQTQHDGKAPYHIHQRLDKVALPEQHISPHRVAVLCEVELVEEDVNQTAVDVRGGLLDEPLQPLHLNEGERERESTE